MEQPKSPLYLTALTVIAYILFHLWLVILSFMDGSQTSMSSNTTQSLLDSLLFTSENKWGIDDSQIMENMNKIAFHESKGNPSAIQQSDETTTGIGPGRGLFQFEVGKDQGAHTAINRLIAQIGYTPDFVKGLKEKDYDISGLSPEQQKIIFLGNLLQKPLYPPELPGDRDYSATPSLAEDMYVPPSFAGVDTDEELAAYWAQHHQAGTTPGTEEYSSIIDKFTEDIAYYPKKNEKDEINTKETPYNKIINFLTSPYAP